MKDLWYDVSYIPMLTIIGLRAAVSCLLMIPIYIWHNPPYNLAEAIRSLGVTALLLCVAVFGLLFGATFAASILADAITPKPIRKSLKQLLLGKEITA